MPPKIWHMFVRFITSSNIDQFSNVFCCQNQKKICNSTITKDPTTPQMFQMIVKTILHLTAKSCRKSSMQLVAIACQS